MEQFPEHDVDFIAVDWQAAAKRIGRDLVSPAPCKSRATPIVFQAKWVQRQKTNGTAHTPNFATDVNGHYISGGLYFSTTRGGLASPPQKEIQSCSPRGHR